MWFVYLSWVILASVIKGEDDYYAPQTFKQMGSAELFQPVYQRWRDVMRNQKITDSYNKAAFTPAQNDVSPQSSNPQSWRPGPSSDDWRAPEQWVRKEQQASILHHKQALTSEGSFRFEYASDNGLAAGEVIEPDGSRVGAYQYKDPTGKLVKLKYRAGKEGFQILEGSHLPQSPQPQQPDNYYQNAYAQQKQYDNQHNQRPEVNQDWTPQNQGAGNQGAGGQYFNQNWSSGNQDGQYRDNELMEHRPHSFGGGYAFAFKG
ncbi:PREDICTED: uncharacterized protein LOC106110656 isoform X2 [Papilio polytes]|uniref:uncharacterized protein LOC106110656 isoform X2 n=1 Tax=Papilio polytes TaxID=76194 RepID=UPI000676A4E0|nr:PREDICTED: uncharacterized protein LOC106110656 isoform X2 [Papilio polytes]